jgi:hypothetical protein
MSDEITGGILLMILIISFFSWIGISSYNDKQKSKVQKEKNKIRQQKQDVLLEKEVIHLGGHPYLDSSDLIYLQIKNNNTLYCYKENAETGEEISLNQLTKYELMTNEQISKDITLSRFLVFGIASLAFKKETKSTNEYLHISYTQNDVNIDCLFKNTNNQPLGDIISTLNRLKIEENRG